MAVSGYVKIRKDLPAWLFDDPVKLRWYVDLMMLSCDKEKGGIKKMQVNMTMHTLAKRWGVSVPLVSRYLRALDQADLVILLKQEKYGSLQKALQEPLRIFVRDFSELREVALQKALQESLQVKKKSCSKMEGSERYVKFIGFLEKKAPYCYKNMTLPTEVEFYAMIEKYGAKTVAEICEQIENRKDLRKTYTNLYRTLLNWLDNEMKRRNGTTV